MYIFHTVEIRLNIFACSTGRPFSWKKYAKSILRTFKNRKINNYNFYNMMGNVSKLEVQSNGEYHSFLPNIMFNPHNLLLRVMKI